MVDIDDLTISPKPPSSGMITDWATLDYTVNQLFNYGSNFSLKIVVFNEIDLKYAKQVFARYAHLSIPKFLSVGNLDVKSDDPELASKLLQSLGWLFDKVIADPDLNDVRPLPQLHTLVWGNKQGV
jgi:7-carboxy-7-deazaguanine synthase